MKNPPAAFSPAGFFDPDEMERAWGRVVEQLRAEGHDVEAMTEAAGRNLPATVEEMERRRNTPWTPDEVAGVARFVMEGPL